MEVRTVGTIVQRTTPGDAVALGQTALALGNQGLALEYFRRAARADQRSIGALTGIAACYDVIGRADLARRYYEEALAIAPGDLALLGNYAASLARHGEHAKAQAVIAEIALRRRAPAVQWVIEAAPASAQAAAAQAGPAHVATAPVPAPDRLTSVPRAPVREAVARPRLERVSLGEIALITTGAPLWKQVRLAAPARPVRLLNAARIEGLAARRRVELRAAGWSQITIGDATRRRSVSVLLYPAGQHEAARKMANRLGIAAIRIAPRNDFLALLGRDQG